MCCLVRSWSRKGLLNDLLECWRGVDPQCPHLLLLESCHHRLWMLQEVPQPLARVALVAHTVVERLLWGALLQDVVELLRDVAVPKSLDFLLDCSHSRRCLPLKKWHYCMPVPYSMGPTFLCAGALRNRAFVVIRKVLSPSLFPIMRACRHELCV